jgi:hypothetical protein
MAERTRDDLISQAIVDLHQLGYARQLFREIGRVLQLRHLVFDHLDSHRCHPALRLRPQVCRPAQGPTRADESALRVLEQEVGQVQDAVRG